MTSQFDPNQFLGMNHEGKLDTRAPLAKAGQSQPAQILRIIPRFFQGDNKDFHVLDFYWDVQDEEQKRHFGVKELIARQPIFVDLITAEGQVALDTSPYKSVQLGRLREELGMNKGGKWNLQSMIGLMGKVDIEHRPDNRDKSVLYANVTKVTGLGGTKPGAARPPATQQQASGVR